MHESSQVAWLELAHFPHTHKGIKAQNRIPRSIEAIDVQHGYFVTQKISVLDRGWHSHGIK